MRSRRGSSLIIVLVGLAVSVPAAMLLVKRAADQNRLNTRLRAMHSARGMAQSMPRDYMGMFAADWYADHFDPARLTGGFGRMDLNFGSGALQSTSLSGNYESADPTAREDVFRSMKIISTGRYLLDTGFANMSKNHELVVEFRSDLSRYGYIFPNGAVMGGAGPGAYFESENVGTSVYVGGDLDLPGNVVFSSSPIVVKGEIRGGVGTNTFAPGSVLYYSTAPLPGLPHTFSVAHHFTWVDDHFASPMVDVDYYRSYYYYKSPTTTDQAWVFKAGDIMDIYVSPNVPASGVPDGTFDFTMSTSSIVLLAEDVGTLTVTGTVSNHPTIVCVSADPAKGNIDVQGDFVYNGGPNANAGDSVAVLASGRIRLQPTPGANQFRGVYFSKGVIEGDDSLAPGAAITVTGTLIAQNFENKFITVTPDPAYHQFPASRLPARPRVVSYIAKP
jgi:hypothetical protein